MRDPGKRILRRAGLTLVLVVAGGAMLLYLGRSRFVAFTFSPDLTAVRPRNYCLLNPFRDTKPETLADQCLGKLREGVTAVISPYVSSQSILGEEQRWPIQSWRVGGRTDRAEKIELMYWVTRGNGYSVEGQEEEVLFTFIRSGTGWEVESYSAIY